MRGEIIFEKTKLIKIMLKSSDFIIACVCLSVNEKLTSR